MPTLSTRVLLLAGLVLAIPAATASARAQESAPAAQTASKAANLAISVVPPKQREMADTILVTGTLVAREEVQVGPEIEGYRLVQILAEVGDEVKKGQVLARLSRETLDTQLAQNTANQAKAKAAIAQQKAQIDQMAAQLAEATSAVERSRQLRKSGTASQETLDERERAVKVATAQLAASKESLAAAEAEAVLVDAQRAELELKIKRTDIRSPADGIVLSRDARVGAIVLSTRQEPLFRLAEDGAIDLDAEIPEAAMPRLALGQVASVTPAGFAQPLDGKVRLISAEVDKASRLGRARIALPADPRLKPGAFARAMLQLGRHEALVVPQSAVQFDTDGAYVLTVVDGLVAERRVEAGLKSEGLVEIRSGVSTTDRVVVRAGGFLRDGDRVNAVEADTTTSEAR